MNLSRTLFLSALFVGTAVLVAETRDERVLRDRRELLEDESWVYNDLAKGFQQAAQTGKPLLIVFR